MNTANGKGMTVTRGRAPRLAAIAVMIASGLALTGTTAAAQSYTVTDLGTLGGIQSAGKTLNNAGQVAGEVWLPGNQAQHCFLWSEGTMIDIPTGPYCMVRAMNATGDVTGEATMPDGGLHAFRFSGGVMTDLGVLSGGASYGAAINASGQVAGIASVATFPGTAHAFRYSDGVLSDLGTLGGGWSAATAINNDGHVTGYAHTASHYGHAFLYRDGAMTDLGTLGGAYSKGQAINSAGQITGEADTAGGGSHAFLYANGVMTDLGTLGGPRSQGWAINEAGQIAGWSWVSNDGETHAFLYSDGTMRDLGTLGGTSSFGLAINASGHVTGSSTLPGSIERHAFVSTGSQMVDLNTRIPADSGWTLHVGNAINDRGQIAGYGTINGEIHGFLLTPTERQLAAEIQPPIADDGSSVFSAKRGVVPVRFTLTENGMPTCELPPATITVSRMDSVTVGVLDETVYLAAADEGDSFRVSDCQYIYHLAASSLGVGRYRVEIAIDGRTVGQAAFAVR